MERTDAVDPAEVEEGFEHGYSETPPFGVPDFDDVAQEEGRGPSENPRPLASADEGIQVVMSVLWVHFTKGASNAARDITYEAIDRLDGLLRPEVKEILQNTPGQDPAKFPFADHAQDWEQLGERAAARTNGELLHVAEIEGAYRDQTGRTPPPEAAPVLPLTDHACETIGNHMWFWFTLGTLTGDQSYDFGYEVIQAGRKASRGWLYKNVEEVGLVEGGRINYATWENERELGRICSDKCGFRANRIARQAPYEEILATHFKEAWCSVGFAMAKVAERMGKPVGEISVGCS